MQQRWIGYLLAVLIQMMMLGITILLTHLFVSFSLPGMFLILGILIVALMWGAGPSLFATITATFLLYFFLLHPQLSKQMVGVTQLIEMFLFFLVGSLISFLVSRLASVRTEAELARSHLEDLVNQLKQEKEALARMERSSAEQARLLEAIIETVPDALFFTDAEGNSVRMNASGRAFLSVDNAQGWRGKKLGAYLWVRDGQQKDVPLEQWPSSRILQGEVLSSENAAELILRRADGQDRYVSMTGGPLLDAQQRITGAVTVIRDITERHILEQRTQEALKALLLLAENLVQVGGEKESGERDGVAQHLVELIRNVLNCERVSLTIVDPVTGMVQSLAVIGLSPEQEQLWRERQPGFNVSERLEAPAYAKLLEEKEVVILDMAQPELSERPNPLHLSTLLLAPLIVAQQLVGVLTVDHGGKEHTFTSSEQALVKAVAKLAAIVVERERLLRERAEALANEVTLRETNRLMDEFVGIAGHELRTPLTTIKASVQLAKRQIMRMQKTDQNTEIQSQLTSIQGFLERAERQVTMQNRLVNDLLDISRVQANRLELYPALFDLAKLVRETIDDQRQSLPDRQITLSLLDESELLIVADRDRIRQVITNYLSNALKYSEITKSVDVAANIVGSFVRVLVRDEGPGLSSLEQQRVWERFYRVEGIEVQSGSGVGLGLGLHICRTIVERQGGEVGVESTPGYGSTFWFMLPLAEAPSQP